MGCHDHIESEEKILRRTKNVISVRTLLVIELSSLSLLESRPSPSSSHTGWACLSMDFNRVLRDILASWRCHCSFWAHVWAGGHCVKTSMQQQSSQMTSRLAWLMMALLRPRRRIHIQPKLSSSKAVMTHDLWQTDTVIPFPTYLLLD